MVCHAWVLWQSPSWCSVTPGSCSASGGFATVGWVTRGRCLVRVFYDRLKTTPLVKEVFWKKHTQPPCLQDESMPGSISLCQTLQTQMGEAHCWVKPKTWCLLPVGCCLPASPRLKGCVACQTLLGSCIKIQHWRAMRFQQPKQCSLCLSLPAMTLKFPYQASLMSGRCLFLL